MKYNDNGEYKDIYIKTFDTLPVGAEVDYIGSIVPDGWTQVDSYSTSEIDTGETWIDGSKIYRKVIDFTTASSAVTSWTTCGTITNLKRPIKVYGYLEYNSTTSSVIPTFESSSIRLQFSFSGNNLQYQCEGYLNKKCYVIVEYTKSS